eukprot:GHRR01015376.1.p1 GENE.GHRR01015376.1~~GHRR01015376.1.p1  ORF type:complete len:261 (+),score=69.79 GHRR01015376.1:1117-1899(+)
MTDVFATFYTNGEKDSSGNTICIQHMLPDLDCLMDFMHTALSTASIPSGVLRYCLDEAGKEWLFQAEELPNPKRVRLPVPAQRQSSMMQQAFRVLAEYAAGGSDVARLDDLEGFEDQGAAFKDHDGHVLKHSNMYRAHIHNHTNAANGHQPLNRTQAPAAKGHERHPSCLLNHSCRLQSGGGVPEEGFGGQPKGWILCQMLPLQLLKMMSSTNGTRTSMKPDRKRSICRFSKMGAACAQQHDPDLYCNSKLYILDQQLCS